MPRITTSGCATSHLLIKLLYEVKFLVGHLYNDGGTERQMRKLNKQNIVFDE
jgi:hypothetical protein